MAYSLIIADDVKIMRDSLTHIVDWDALGFDLKTSFSDGAQVLEYLKDNPLDVLLIDIKMIKISGLDVAAFIHIHSLPTKVIILTGHRNFEYAQQAIEYKVEHYLLKPLSLPEIKRIFGLIRENLDKAAARERLIDGQMDAYNRLLDYEKEQFIAELAHGTLTDSKQLKHRIALIGISEGELSLACIRFELRLTEDAQLNDLQKEYGTQGLLEYLTKVLRTFDDMLDFYLLDLLGLQMTGVLLEKKRGKLNNYSTDPQKFERAISRLLHMTLGLSSQVKLICYFPKLTDMLAYVPKESGPSEGLKAHLAQQKKLLMSYIAGFEPDLALPLFRSLVRQYRVLGLEACKDQVMHFFANVIVQLKDRFPETYEMLSDRISFMEAAALPTENALVEWGQQKIAWLIEKQLSQGGGKSNKNIEKIKFFIEEHYSKNITLADLAEQVYMNPAYISRVFKDKTGMTFSEYLTDVRIAAAARLLEQPNVYVYEVCEQVGYQNIKHFYKVFRKKMGCSPVEYRERRIP